MFSPCMCCGVATSGGSSSGTVYNQPFTIGATILCHTCPIPGTTFRNLTSFATCEGKCLHPSTCVLLFQRMSDTVRVTPSVLAVPGILFVILLTVGCWAVVWSSNKRDNFILSDTVVMASTTVSALEYSLSMGHLPALMLASYVREVPNWQELQPRFVRMGTNIMSQINMEVGGQVSLLEIGCCNRR